jgi:hypothetical protein
VSGSRRWALWLVLLAVAAWLALFGDKTPPGAAAPGMLAAPATPAQRSAAKPAPPLAAARSTGAVEAIEALQPRKPAAGETAPPVADLFRNAIWRAPPPPAPPPPPFVGPEQVAVPPQPYRVIGKKLQADAWEVFLGRGDASFIARVGDTLEGLWRVEQIEPPTLRFTHLPSGQQQTLDIGAAP